MTIRILGLSAVALLGLAAPALAQAPDFGADTSVWANDGECDDPRFTGAGMAAVTTDADLMGDASDCRAAFEAGTVTLAQGGATAPATQTPAVTPTATPTDPVKGGQAPQATATIEAPATPTQPPALPAAAGGAVNFGDDTSQWANDGECDDRRFAGAGMAAVLSWENTGHDASDCRAAYETMQVRLWDLASSLAATQCAAIDFGTDAGQYPNDGECDDIRFEGPYGMALGMSVENTGLDASDCSQACSLGTVGLRDY